MPTPFFLSGSDTLYAQAHSLYAMVGVINADYMRLTIVCGPHRAAYGKSGARNLKLLIVNP